MDAYIAKIKNIEKRMRSRSGGVFVAVSDIVLQKGGVVYGCILDEEFNAVHARATTTEQRDRMCGSKYVQSVIGDALKNVLSDLRCGKTVLFSGTPCQCDGMRQICPAQFREQLVLMDIVCHGVPSPNVWNDYKKYMEHKYHGKITAVDFRNKRHHGWWDHVESVKIHGIERDSQVYMKLFYEHNILMDSCHACPYKSLERISDITIADAWGIAKANPEFDDNRGVSLVLANTERGAKWLKEAWSMCEVLAVDIKEYMQDPFKFSFQVADNYEEFWQMYDKEGFEAVVKKGYEDSFKKRIYWRIKRIVKRVVPQYIIKKVRGEKQNG